VCWLVLVRFLSLQVLHFTALSKNGLLFLRSFFGQVIASSDEGGIRGIFSRYWARDLLVVSLPHSAPV
jgi:hypothetical protein